MMEFRPVGNCLFSNIWNSNEPLQRVERRKTPTVWMIAGLHKEMWDVPSKKLGTLRLYLDLGLKDLFYSSVALGKWSLVMIAVSLGNVRGDKLSFFLTLFSSVHRLGNIATKVRHCSLYKSYAYFKDKVALLTKIFLIFFLIHLDIKALLADFLVQSFWTYTTYTRLYNY